MYLHVIVTDNSTSVTYSYCTGSWYARAICKKHVPQPPESGAHRPAAFLVPLALLYTLVALLILLTLTTLGLLLLALCLMRCRLARSLLAPPRTRDRTPSREMELMPARGQMCSATYGGADGIGDSPALDEREVVEEGERSTSEKMVQQAELKVSALVGDEKDSAGTEAIIVNANYVVES